jgi:P-loop containing dynein motor region D4
MDKGCGIAGLIRQWCLSLRHLYRLASFICGYEVFQIAVSSSYGVTEFKENLLSLYTLAGVKGTPVTFLMTDNQIVKEKFLVFINDLLSTGYIADLCTQVSSCRALCSLAWNPIA